MKNIVTFLFLSTSAFAQLSLDSIALDVAHNELLFSHTSVIKGRNDSFVEFFDDSCVMLDPFPVNGKQRFKNIPKSKTILTWKPSCVEISSGGDLAYSTGPWEIRPSKLTDAPIYVGDFFSIWKNTGAGWKVVFDHGVSYPKSEVKEEKFHYLIPAVIRKESENTVDAIGQMMSVENKFIAERLKGSNSSAYGEYAAGNIRLIRNDKYPVTGKKAAIKRTADGERFTTYSSFDSKISHTGDLGYTYGIAVDGKKDTSIYIRVWRKEQGWKIAVDVMNPIH
jgi:ketosteroid isomerase-like protein